MTNLSRYAEPPIDALDRRILAALADDGRMSTKALAEAVGLSAPSTAERVRRLESRGVILGYGVRIDPAALGLTLGVIVRVRPMPGELARVAGLLASKPEIVQCDRVTGDDCFVARAFVASVGDLERLIDDLLPYAATNTALIQSSPVSTRAPDLAGGRGTPAEFESKDRSAGRARPG